MQNIKWLKFRFVEVEKKCRREDENLVFFLLEIENKVLFEVIETFSSPHHPFDTKASIIFYQYESHMLRFVIIFLLLKALKTNYKILCLINVFSIREGAMFFVSWKYACMLM